MPKIIKRVVDTIRPDAARDSFIWDTELKGFGIRTKPSGVSAYLIQYRNEHGRTRRMVIGRVGILTPDQARQIARDRLASVAHGGDPSAERRAARQAITVSDLCDWYLEQAQQGRLLGRRGTPIKPSTVAMDRSRIETHVKPLIGTRVVDSLDLSDIENLQSSIASGRAGKAREGRGGLTTGGAGVASRTAGMLHAIFEHARRKKLIRENPARGVRKIAGTRKKRRLSAEEIRRLGAAMTQLAADGENPVGLAAIRFIALTDLRRAEALGAMRAWIDPVQGSISLPDTKTGAQIRAVGAAAMDVLDDLPQDAYLFPSSLSKKAGPKHFVGIAKVLERVTAKAKLTEVTVHTLRHTFASVAGDLGFTKLTIAGLLGHASRGDTESYVHLDRALVLAANRVSEEIAGLLKG